MGPGQPGAAEPALGPLGLRVQEQREAQGVFFRVGLTYHWDICLR